MISAGKMDKRIIIQHLTKIKDEYGAEVEKWDDVYTCKAKIYARKDTSIRVTEYEVINELEFVCITRHLKDCFKYQGLEYRILYNSVAFCIMGIDNENDSQTKFILKQINI
jgi:SPP1 family predicted phage head-tail adaptor